MSAEIFISYARADRDRVQPLVERLREAGVTYWLDEGNIQGATLWGKEIVEAIRNAKVLVLFATEASFESKNVAKEVAIASEWEKPILPVYLERVQVPDTLHYQLAGIQHGSFSPIRRKRRSTACSVPSTPSAWLQMKISRSSPLQWPRITPRSSSKNRPKAKNR